MRVSISLGAPEITGTSISVTILKKKKNQTNNNNNDDGYFIHTAEFWINCVTSFQLADDEPFSTLELSRLGGGGAIDATK